MKVGICKECLGEVPITDENNVALVVSGQVYECPTCDYPNGLKCGDFWEIYEK